ncbi:hypothetical protein [Bradyrhizobium elkanii]|nr:hypothetical protein [Bradyrhizobium elkanii]MCP1973843.1 ABC-type Fe3+ transport system permease subunit [Bradyrhizobium elkanii]MCS3520906.1 ABC-type Fe3+ transport system permease subunit [Bradyrhizobium elkanii]MCS4068563.1 ABC-type Fe3+ transport system permease subunit [Bradyrhizobium elkanii]MCS4084097.1 ABC-type Fe3+ transport system permease subunit [Bradyrhizobium elkanii]MCS4104652.1 ABC-type Fe3+ transport system permease subunit [Bradyrhizobium elkanii]
MESESTPSRPGEAAWEALTFDEPVNVALAIWAALLVAHVIAASVYYWREQRRPEWLAALAILAYLPILVPIICLGLVFKYLIRPLIGQTRLFRRRSDIKGVVE